MIENLHFNLDGINSYDMGLMNVHLDSGMFEENLFGDRSVVEETVRGNETPYLMDVRDEPITFPLTFAFDDGYDKEKLRLVARWLYEKRYRPFYFIGDDDRLFFVIVEGSIQKIHNGLMEGYITLNFKTNSPYGFSKHVFSEEYNVLGGEREIEIENRGDLNLKPELWVQKYEDGDVSIFNLTNGNKEFKFENLKHGETIYVDNEYEEIESSLSGVYRYSDFNNVFLELVTGRNRLLIKGNCIINFKFNYKLLQG